MEKILKYATAILILILTIAVIILSISLVEVSDKKKIYENNIEALTDSLSVVKMSNDKLLYEKKMLIIERDNFAEFVGMQAKEIKELEKKLKSKIATIAKLQENVVIKEIVMHDSIYVYEDTAFIYFNDKNEWYDISGLTKYYKCDAKTTIDSLTMNIPLVIGVTEDNTLFAVSDNPYASFSSINVASNTKINNKKKRWGIGPYVGFGIGWGYGFGFNGAYIGDKGGILAGFTFGIALHYDFFQW